MAERKSSRLIELLTLLLTHRYGVGVDEIRQLRGYPKGGEAFHRQFERDKEMLRDMGFVVVAREDPEDLAHTEYYLDRGRSLLREVQFTPEELAALSLARKLTAHLPLVGAAVREGLSRAGEPTLEEFAPAGIVTPPPPVTGKREQARLRLLQKAVAEDRRLNIKYQALGDSKSESRAVDPYALYVYGGVWYLLGRCHKRKGPRVFRVSRMQEAKLANRGKGGDFELPRGFRLEDYLNRFSFELGKATSGEVVIRFGPHQAWRVGAGLGRRGKVSREAGGTIRLKIPSANPEGLISWILGMGRDVEVISPKGVRAEIGKVARQVAKRHEGRALSRRKG